MNILAEQLSEYELVNSSYSALRKRGDADYQKVVRHEVNQSTTREIQKAQSSGQMFGLAAITVLFVMLILNAISY